MKSNTENSLKNDSSPITTPPRLLPDHLRAAARAHPERTALVTAEGRYSYRELLDAALRFAAGAQALGLKRGDRVAVHLENGFASAVAIYGALLAGGVFVVLHPQTKADKLAYMLADSGARFYVSEPRLAVWLKDAPLDLHVVLVGDALELGSLGRSEAHSFASLLGAEPHPSEPGSTTRDLAALIYTSGTTGKPKGVMMRHENMVFTLGSVGEYLALSDRDRVLNALPLAFSYGLYQLFLTLCAGGTLVLERAFSFPAQLAARLALEQITVLPGVPTMFVSLLAHGRTGLTFPAVTCVTNAAAALPSAFITEVQALFPNARLFNMYGLTECKRVSYLDPALVTQKLGSVGKAIPGTEVLVLGETGQPVQPGEVGVLHVRGPHVMQGYWNQPEASAHMLEPGRDPGERLLCTHDLFTVDAEGFLYFVSRSDDVIKTRGEKVSPTEVENVIYGLPGVREVAVIGVPDPLLGEAVRAYVVLEPGAALRERDIRGACSVQLGGVKVPKTVVFVTELPKTASGKIRRQSLREALAAPSAESKPSGLR